MLSMPKLRCFTPVFAVLAVALASEPAAPAAITGLCPDGSVFIVQTETAIPCHGAKLVTPDEVPPMRPEYLPSPYTWQVYNQSRSPNNPYNLIDAARQIRAMENGGNPPTAPPEVSGAPPAVSSGPPGVSSGVPTQDVPEIVSLETIAPLDLGLADQELRDLFQIVQLSQEYTPASFARETADGRGIFAVSLAHSGAFENRLRDVWASRGGLAGGRVLVFTALSKQPEKFFANFTFVQDHLTFQPDAASARQLGILQGRLGPLQANELVLGYVVLPDQIDLSTKLDIYWNDRRITPRFF
jgi:hypothetical protein